MGDEGGSRRCSNCHVEITKDVVIAFPPQGLRIPFHSPYDCDNRKLISKIKTYKSSYKPLGAADPPKLRMRVGFRATPEREGEETPFFFLGSTSGVFCLRSMRVVLRRKVFFENPKTGSSKQWH